MLLLFLAISRALTRNSVTAKVSVTWSVMLYGAQNSVTNKKVLSCKADVRQIISSQLTAACVLNLHAVISEFITYFRPDEFAFSMPF